MKEETKKKIPKLAKNLAHRSDKFLIRIFGARFLNFVNKKMVFYTTGKEIPTSLTLIPLNYNYDLVQSPSLYEDVKDNSIYKFVLSQEEDTFLVDKSNLEYKDKLIIIRLYLNHLFNNDYNHLVECISFYHKLKRKKGKLKVFKDKEVNNE